ncbi:MAG: HD domain-containing protein [Chitinophagales bacterium]
MNEIEYLTLTDLPQPIPFLLQNHKTPLILQKHLLIVHSTAKILLQKLKKNWQTLIIDEEAILFGAASHDIGKAIEVSELYESGKKHEEVGYQLLVANEISHGLARFARTHGNWQAESLELEDLLVALADKIWKGKRVEKLEERVCRKLAAVIEVDYWTVFLQLDSILMEMTLVADDRLTWQES